MMKEMILCDINTSLLCFYFDQNRFNFDIAIILPLICTKMWYQLFGLAFGVGHNQYHLFLDKRSPFSP